MTGSGNDTSLDLFYPVPRIEQVAGVAVAVPQLKVRQYAAFQTAVQPIMGYMIAADYLGAVTHETEASARTVVVATGVERDWLDERPVDELMQLLAAVCEVQIDFFTRRLRPVQSELESRTRALMVALDGPQPLPSSSDPATALPNAAS